MPETETQTSPEEQAPPPTDVDGDADGDDADDARDSGETLDPEVEEVVNQVQARIDADPAAPKRKKRRRRSKQTKRVDIDDLPSTPERTEPLPVPELELNDLDGLMARYQIGDDMDFEVRLHRAHPTHFGNTPAKGYYETYQRPISEDFIGREFGGGVYRVFVYGPQPEGKRGKRIYGQVTATLPGDPNEDKLPHSVNPLDRSRSNRGGLLDDEPRGPSRHHEAPTLAQQAMRNISDVAKDERKRSHDLERELRSQLGKPDGGQNNAQIMNLLTKVYESRANESAQFTKDRMDREERIYEDRTKELSRQVEELKSRAANNGGGSVASTIKEIVPLLKSDGDGGKAILEMTLQKQRDEMESVRQSHRTEVQVVHDAHARALEAERQSSISREDRLKDLLERERDDRRRDQERFTQSTTERDRQWEDRLKSQLDNNNVQWEARYNTRESGLETRIEFLKGEMERVRTDADEQRRRNQDQSDPYAQLQKLRGLGEFAKEMFGADSSGSSSGDDGIGNIIAKGFADDPKGFFSGISGFMGHAFGGGGAPGGQPQPVMTPQGPMVQAPDGSWVPAPQPQSQSRAIGPGGKPTRRRAGVRGGGSGGRRMMPDVSDFYREREMDPEPRRHPDETVEQEVDVDEPRTERRTTRDRRPRRREQRSVMARRERDSESDGESAPLLPKDDTVVLASTIDQALAQGDDPQAFVEKISDGTPEDILRSLAALEPEQVHDSIEEHVGESAATTPAGQRFVREALDLLRHRFGGG